MEARILMHYALDLLFVLGVLRVLEKRSIQGMPGRG
jgi:hypothetical protein